MVKRPVSLVLWNLGRAGAERIVFELAKRLPDHGFSVRVIAAGGGGDLVKEFRAADIPLEIGPAVPVWRRLDTIRFLRRSLRLHRPCLIHTHVGADQWMRCARPSGLPWLITAHNDDKDDSLARHWLRRLAFREATAVACVSQAVRRYVKKEFFVPADRLSVIPNGLDMQALPYRGHRPFHDIPVLVTVGRLVQQKNHTTLLRGLAAVRRPWKLLIAGDGPLRSSLERLANHLGIQGRVHFLGVVPRVDRVLFSADIFCFPSRWEGQGLALLEAAAVGVPIVASRLPVFRETFSPHMMSFVDPVSPDAWTRAMEDALAEPSLLLRRSGAAQRAVWDRHAVEPMVRAYASLYHHLLL